MLSARGIETPEQAAAFLEREDKLTISPFLMRDMDKAAARVQQAIAGGERIAVFGDYDVDGITATCILVDYLKSRGADVVHYIPRRIEDGYGLSRDAIKGLFDQGVRLLVTVDCGITGVERWTTPTHWGWTWSSPTTTSAGGPAPGPWLWWTPTGRTARTPSSIWPAAAWR